MRVDFVHEDGELRWSEEMPQCPAPGDRVTFPNGREVEVLARHWVLRDRPARAHTLGEALAGDVRVTVR